ncbi:N-acetyl-gamma-glutamyl-phosphate reductase [Ferruginibacter albus]|uniref:N-acetyl-gamma-glutamyl-phosphate reductase n=1 Tax=Ferruginibacter albus TaxID=2875540 RepID=UPI001CC7ABB6|nr:N-acetyl-gamma-glutamyl-phosphate reductase [Ferruginibacter albus]UAY51266.1 N-acetyl-gamma-glutamyl-phosphate reductase [Ferruginibacter albus]
MIKAGIIGAAGYTGGELIRILINHPEVEIAFAQSGSNAGNLISKVHADLVGETDLKFSAEHNYDVDVIFFCAGHGEAKKFVEANDIPASVKLIDIGNDFRLNKDAAIKGRKFVYGLPELQREEIKKASNVANPGCFATAIQLGLLPLAKAGLLPNDIYTTGITGSTGAGQSLSPTSHFSWRQNNISAYKTLTHQHNDEIQQSLHQLQNVFPASPKDGGLSFVPWRGDFTRGIFISSQMNCDLSIEELNKLYEDFYAGHPFTAITKEPVFLKQVVNTNKCIIQLEKVGSRLVVHSVIDNLTKGASGQAVQNMNLIFGLGETTGLKLKANSF